MAQGMNPQKMLKQMQKMMEDMARVQAELQAALMACWGAERTILEDGDLPPEGVASLAAKIDRAGGRELDLVFESLAATGSLD